MPAHNRDYSLSQKDPGDLLPCDICGDTDFKKESVVPLPSRSPSESGMVDAVLCRKCQQALEAAL